MTLRKTLVASALMLVLGASAAVAQQQTGEIYGRAADNSGAVLPGATVTVAGPALIQPRVAVTSESGTYRVPELPIGTYSVTFELAGFRSMVLQDIRVTIGFRGDRCAWLDQGGARNRDGRARQDGAGIISGASVDFTGLLLCHGGRCAKNEQQRRSDKRLSQRHSSYCATRIALKKRSGPILEPFTK